MKMIGGANSTESIYKGSRVRIEHVQATSIDEFVCIRGIDRVDFIKADIEGAERNMLKGARNVLKKYAPSLALCTYHLHDDSEVLPFLIGEANSEYEISHKWRKVFAAISDS